MGNERDVFDPPDPGRAAERLGRTPAPSRERARRSLLDSKRSPLAGDEQITLIPTTTPTAITQPTAPPTPPTALIPPAPAEAAPGPAPIGRRSTWEPAPVELDEAETRRYRTTETREAGRTGPSITPWKPGEEGDDAPDAPVAPPIAGSTAKGRPAGLPIAGSIATPAPLPRRETPTPPPAAAPPADPPAVVAVPEPPVPAGPDAQARSAPMQPVWEESPAEGAPERSAPPRVQRVTTNTAWDPEPSEEAPYPASLDNAAVPRVFVEDSPDDEPPAAPAAKTSQTPWVWIATIGVLSAIGVAAVIVISGGALFHAAPAAPPKPAPTAITPPASAAPRVEIPPPPPAPAPPPEAAPAAPTDAPAARAKPRPPAPKAAPKAAPAAVPQPTDGPSPWGPLPDAPDGSP